MSSQEQKGTESHDYETLYCLEIKKLFVKTCSHMIQTNWINVRSAYKFGKLELEECICFFSSKT